MSMFSYILRVLYRGSCYFKGDQASLLFQSYLFCLRIFRGSFCLSVEGQHQRFAYSQIYILYRFIEFSFSETRESNRNIQQEILGGGKICRENRKQNTVILSVFVIILLDQNLIRVKMLNKKILCIGGTGQLGKVVIQSLLPYHVTNIDFNQHPQAQENLLLNSQLSPSNNNKNVIEQFKKSKPLYDSIIVTAGGWAGGSIKDDDYFQKTQNMIDVCLTPTLLGAHLATKYLSPNGLVVFTGAAAVFKEPQPEMIGYAIAKTGVHSLALNLTHYFINHELSSKVVTILPETIDTETNRQAMPKSDFSKWSKPQQIGGLLRSWIDGHNVPNNGSFAVLKVKNGAVIPDFV